MPDPYGVAERLRRDLLELDRDAAAELTAAYRDVYRAAQEKLAYYTERGAAARRALEAGGRDAEDIRALLRGDRYASATTRQLLTELAASEFQTKRWAATAMDLEALLDDYNRIAEGITRNAQGDAIQLGLTHSRAVLDEQLPGYAFSMPDDAALRSMVGFTQRGAPLSNLFERLAPEMIGRVRQTLLLGMGLGTNPAVLARQLRGPLGIPHWRAMTIARTETLRTYRESQRAVVESNADILEGWVWHSARDPRTCEVCWANDGKVFKIASRSSTAPPLKADKTMPATRPTEARAAAVYDVVRGAQRAEPAITADIVSIGNELGLDPNTSFTMLHGPNAGKTFSTLDARLKTYDSSLRKATNDYGNTAPEQLAGVMKDNVRYTYVTDSTRLNGSMRQAADALRSRGYTPFIGARPRDTGYWGVNTWWQDAQGQVFEVQFHTQASFEAKEVHSHSLYEEQRILDVATARYREVTQQINDLWAGLRVREPALNDFDSSWFDDYFEAVK